MTKILLSVRLSPQMVERVRSLAETERRSLGVQTEILLEAGLRTLYPEAVSKPTLPIKRRPVR